MPCPYQRPVHVGSSRSFWTTTLEPAVRRGPIRLLRGEKRLKLGEDAPGQLRHAGRFGG
jgi:hypothetical protein